MNLNSVHRNIRRIKYQSFFIHNRDLVLIILSNYHKAIVASVFNIISLLLKININSSVVNWYIWWCHAIVWQFESCYYSTDSINEFKLLGFKIETKKIRRTKNLIPEWLHETVFVFWNRLLRNCALVFVQNIRDLGALQSDNAQSASSWQLRVCRSWQHNEYELIFVSNRN